MCKNAKLYLMPCLKIRQVYFYDQLNIFLYRRKCVYIPIKINLFAVGADILLEFLEVAFHHVLFFRKIYPKEIFVKRKVYGSTVYVSEHPELNEYLLNVLNSIRELIKEDANSVKAINLIFYNSNKLPTEKFVFDMVKLQAELTEYVEQLIIIIINN